MSNCQLLQITACSVYYSVNLIYFDFQFSPAVTEALESGKLGGALRNEFNRVVCDVVKLNTMLPKSMKGNTQLLRLFQSTLSSPTSLGAEWYVQLGNIYNGRFYALACVIDQYMTKQSPKNNILINPRYGLKQGYKHEFVIFRFVFVVISQSDDDFVIKRNITNSCLIKVCVSMHILDFSGWYLKLSAGTDRLVLFSYFSYDFVQRSEQCRFSYYWYNRARNNVPNVPDHGDRQSQLFADQIKIWPIMQKHICLSFLEKNLNMLVNTYLNRRTSLTLFQIRV